MPQEPAIHDAPTAGPRAAATVPGTRGRDARADGLRGLAALAVFAFHAWLYTRPVVQARMPHAFGEQLLHEGRLGLVLFFVLSGYLLFSPWVRQINGGPRPPRLGVYALRRVARIVPAYLLALAGSVALLYPLAGTTGVRLPPAGELWRFVLFAQNTSLRTVMKLDPPMWTLAIEASFYALLPLVGWVVLRRGGRRWQAVLACVVLMLAGVAYNVAAGGLDMRWTKSLPAMLPYFGAGMLAACRREGAIGARAAVALLVAGVLAVAADMTLQITAGTGGPALLPGWLRDLPAAGGFACIITALTAGPVGRLSRAWSGLARVGTLSYGIYLWNVPMLLVVRAGGLGGGAWRAAACALVLTLGAAAVSWRVAERPAIRRAHGTRAPRQSTATGRAIGVT